MNKTNSIMSLSLEAKKALVANFNMIDDTFFSKVMEDVGAAEELIQTILEDGGISIVSSEPQVSIRNAGNKSVVLDLLCSDSKGNYFNVEIQRNDGDNLQKRMRYYTSNLDTRSAEKGTAYQDLPDIFSIMISEFDIFKLGKTVYYIDRVLRVDGSKQENGIHELYVNATGKDGGAITQLMEFMLNSKGYNEHFPRISSRVNYLKESKEGVHHMCKWEEEMMAASKAEGRAEGKLEGKAEVLKVLGISEAEYEKKLAESKSN